MSARSNQRDERGWGIPPKGSKSYEYYHLLVAGWTPFEITELFQEDQEKSSIRVLCSRIKNPGNRLPGYNSSNAKRRQRRSLLKLNDSPYVEKLVVVLGYSRADARAEEKKQLAKEAAKVVK